MPKITRLPFITSGTTATSFLVVDALATRRLLYTDFVDRVVSEIGAEEFTGPTGPAGPAGPPGEPGVSTIPGPTGPTGPSTLPVGGASGQVLTKLSGNNFDAGWADVSGGGGGGEVGLSSREESSIVATGVDAGDSLDVTASGFKTYILSKVSTSSPAWVRIYSDANSRANDAARTEGTDPLPGSGVIAEVITTPGFLTQLITPGVVGFNNDSTPGNLIYLAVKNTDSVSRDITVNLSILQLEA
jgi:hypothetical protein